MTNLIKNFATSESGAVTVDWVVLTAALVGLGLAVMAVVSGGVENLSADIGQSLADANPETNPFAANATFTGAGDSAQSFTMPE
jgi:Flp pilus assembly pilin Flp